MTFQPGDKLGPYEILMAIGAGGMGEVFRARDTRLDRDVAIKVSAEQFSERFEREARAIAALNHPNICTLFDVGASPSGAAYLVMEHIEGETVAERTAHGPIPTEEALRLAAQIADALDAAHEKGITHRDLKPANIKIKPDGSVKVLDFGLAKLSHPGESGAGPISANSPTLTIGMTNAGMIVGTAAYMSPEQARGKNVDKRADIWAFGVVLYEMLTAKRLFDGEDVGHTLASVIMREPDFSGVPEQVVPLLKRCLEKDPRKRLRDIGDAMALVQSRAGSQPAAGLRSGSVEASSTSRLGLISIATALLFAVAAAALAFVHFREKPPETPRLSASLLPPDGAAFDFVNYALPALAPDGTRIVFGAKANGGRSQLWIRRLDSAAAQPLPGTEDGYMPFWSPDSQQIGFAAGLALKKIDIAGSPPVTVTNLPAPLRGATWGTQGLIVYSTSIAAAVLYQIPAAGGSPTPATTLDKTGDPLGHRFPWFLPDGRHFLYLSTRVGDIPVLVGSIDGPKTAGKQVALANSNVIYAQGQLLYLRENVLMAQPFDPQRLATTGEARPIAERIATYMQPSRVAGMTVSDTGLLALTSSDAAGASHLTWMDRSGKQIGTLGESSETVGDLELSPDQKSLVVSLGKPGATNLWIVDIARGVRTRFTFGTADFELDPIWSPDGAMIVWRSSRRPEQVFRKASNGTGAEQPMHEAIAGRGESPSSISPDGKFLLYTANGAGTSGGTNDLMLWPLIGIPAGAKQEPRAFVSTPFNEREGHFSPDGKWVIYSSNESGTYEIYAAPFPGPGGKRQISSGGGVLPRWRRDGKEIFYVTRVGQLMVTEVAERNGTLDIGKAQMLFGGLITGRGMSYDVSADGKKFIVIQENATANGIAPLTLIQNWPSLLKK